MKGRETIGKRQKHHKEQRSKDRWTACLKMSREESDCKRGGTLTCMSMLAKGTGG